MQFLFLLGPKVVVCFLGARLGYSFCHDFFSHYGSFHCRYGAFRIFDSPEYAPLLFIHPLYFLGCSVFCPLISSPYFILVFRFEIYDDARTRALASSDYVYDLIEGSRACGGKRSCTLLYIYNSHRTAPHFNPRLGTRFTCRSELFCSVHFPPHCRGWICGLEDSRSELLIECSLADARVLESGFRVGEAACEILIYLFFYYYEIGRAHV